MRIVNATIREEANVKRLLRYSVGNPLCTEIEGCTLDVSAAAGTPLGSVLVMTDAGWAGGVKDRKSCSGKSCVGQEQYDGNRVSSVCYVQETEHDLFELWGIRVDGSGGRRV